MPCVSSEQIDKQTIEFARCLANLVLKNGGIFPSDLERYFQDWSKKQIKKYNPSELIKDNIEEKVNVAGECKYVHMRKAVKGTVCGAKTRNGDYCAKHLAYVKLKAKKALEG